MCQIQVGVFVDAPSSGSLGRFQRHLSVFVDAPSSGFFCRFLVISVDVLVDHSVYMYNLLDQVVYNTKWLILLDFL